MKVGFAILFAIGLVICASVLTEITKLNFIWPMIIITGIWAAWDSSKIELKKYKSGISYGPIVILICHLGLWFLAFPWYLSMRYKIRHGLAELKDRYKSESDAKKYIEKKTEMARKSKPLIIFFILTLLLIIIGIGLYLTNLVTLGRNIVLISLCVLLPLVVVLAIIFRAIGRLSGSENE